MARKLAAKSLHPVAFHAAIVKRGGAIVAAGYNGGIIHAEMHALKKIWPSERVGTTIWSIRITRGGRLAMARPCDKCMEFIKESGVKAIVYSTHARTLVRIKV